MHPQILHKAWEMNSQMITIERTQKEEFGAHSLIWKDKCARAPNWGLR